MYLPSFDRIRQITEGGADILVREKRREGRRNPRATRDCCAPVVPSDMHISLARQIASFIGALLILMAYAGAQFGWMSPRKPWYNILNAVGSAILAYIAFHPFQVGFVLLEVAWTIISLYALVRVWVAE